MTSTPTRSDTKQNEGSDSLSASLSSRKLRERVEEYKLWTDDDEFKNQEYERRRKDKEAKKGAIKSDARLQRCKFGYLLAVVLAVAGLSLFLFAMMQEEHSADAASPLMKYKLALQILGGVILLGGVVVLMAIAAYTYQREDSVRREAGYPTLFEVSQGKSGHQTVFGVRPEEYMSIKSEFVDRKRNSLKVRLQELSAAGEAIREETSKAPSRVDDQEEITQPLLLSAASQLQTSFSSVSSTLSWLNKHELQFYRMGSFALRRQTSDSALDRSFARQYNSSLGDTTSIDTGVDEPSGESRSPCGDGNTEHIFRRSCSEKHKSNVIKHTGSRNNDICRGGKVCSVSTSHKTCHFKSQHACASSTDSSGYMSSECFTSTAPSDGAIIGTLHSQSVGIYSHPNKLPLAPLGMITIVVEDTSVQQDPSSPQGAYIISKECIHTPPNRQKPTDAESDDSFSPPISPDISDLPYLARFTSTSQTCAVQMPDQEISTTDAT